jgi:hypothetical protein
VFCGLLSNPIVFELVVRKNGELPIVTLDSKTCPQRRSNTGWLAGLYFQVLSGIRLIITKCNNL